MAYTYDVNVHNENLMISCADRQSRGVAHTLTGSSYLKCATFLWCCVILYFGDKIVREQVL